MSGTCDSSDTLEEGKDKNFIVEPVQTKKIQSKNGYNEVIVRLSSPAHSYQEGGQPFAIH